MLARFRDLGLQRGGFRSLSPKLARWPVAGWICACVALVAVVGSLQFRWIGQVSASQRTASRALMRVPMEAAVSHFQREVRFLLLAFRPDVDLAPRDRLESYWQTYLSWYGISRYGPVIKRVLFYDNPSPQAGELAELVAEPRSIKRVAWDEGLALVRTHIDEDGFKPGSLVRKRWAHMWMFYPRAMAIYRPIVKLEPDSRTDLRYARVTGYLILQLDLDFIRDKMAPEILTIQLRRLNRDERYIAGIDLDGRSFCVYEPSGTLVSGPDLVPRSRFNYTPRSPHGGSEPRRARRVDFALNFPLLDNGIAESALGRGAVQRVRLHARVQVWPAADPPRALPGSEPYTGLAASFGWWSNTSPRLFLADHSPHRLTFWGRREGISQAEAINREYNRSVAMGIVVLAVLVGAMAMVAISERRAARMAAMRIDAAASQAHQLRTPLATISLLADNMARGAIGSGKKIVRYGEMIRASGRRLSELVDRTARMAAMDSPARPFHLVMLDVSEIAKDALKEAQALIDGAGFTVERSLAEGLPEVKADPQALRQCLDDLLHNAVKYGLPGRWVKVETDETGSGGSRQVRIRVHDRGRGIPAREAPRIFEPFHRAGDVGLSSIPGSGLGLTLVRSAVEGMGARLSLESEVDRGSVFAIHFPVP